MKRGNHNCAYDYLVSVSETFLYICMEDCDEIRLNVKTFAKW